MPVYVVRGIVEEYKTWEEAEIQLKTSMEKSVGVIPKVIDGKQLTVNIISRTVVDGVKLA